MRFRVYIDGIGEEKIIFSSDEIQEVSIVTNKSSNFKRVCGYTTREIKITGKILKQFKDKEIEKYDLYQLQEDWKEKKNALAPKTLQFLTNRFSENGITTLNDIYKSNSKNIFLLLEWVSDKLDENYKNIIIELIGENMTPQILSLEKVYIDFFEQHRGIDNGNGEFTLILKQKIDVATNRWKNH